MSDVLAVKGGAQLKRVCVLTPKGDIGPHSGDAEQLFNIFNKLTNIEIKKYNKFTNISNRRQHVGNS